MSTAASTRRARSAAEALVGPFEVVADLSWRHGGAVVLDVVLAGGRRAIVKRHRLERKLAAEVHAYRSWVPALGDRAPALLAAEEHVLVLSRIDGEPVVKPGSADEHRQAGELLARFHASAPPAPDDGRAERQAEQLERWVGEAPEGLLSADEVAFARRRAGELLELPALPLVPCHADYSARNWLVDRDGRVHVIDFERAGPAWWVHDLGRLWFREWWGRPHLRDAFLEGYGRAPTDDEVAVVERLGTIGHITSIVWATSVGDHDFVLERRARLDVQRGVA